MPSQALDFLTGKVFQFWKLELDMSLTEGISLTWDKFEAFMKRTFGMLDPERDARARFDSLKQTSSAFDYVTEQWSLVK